MVCEDHFGRKDSGASQDDSKSHGSVQGVHLLFCQYIDLLTAVQALVHLYLAFGSYNLESPSNMSSFYFSCVVMKLKHLKKKQTQTQTQRSDLWLPRQKV